MSTLRLVRGCSRCGSKMNKSYCGEEPIRLPCGHVLGKKCVERYLDSVFPKVKCPSCKKCLRRYVATKCFPYGIFKPIDDLPKSIIASIKDDHFSDFLYQKSGKGNVFFLYYQRILHFFNTK